MFIGKGYNLTQTAAKFQFLRYDLTYIRYYMIFTVSLYWIGSHITIKHTDISFQFNFRLRFYNHFITSSFKTYSSLGNQQYQCIPRQFFSLLLQLIYFFLRPTLLCFFYTQLRYNLDLLVFSIPLTPLGLSLCWEMEP